LKMPMSMVSSIPMMKKRKTTMTPTNHLHTHGHIS
jgi:hypothetical protein